MLGLSPHIAKHFSSRKCSLLVNAMLVVTLRFVAFLFKDFQFRQMKKTRVFKSPEGLPKERSSLLALSNKFGLIFVGLERTLKVFLTQDILTFNKVEGNVNEIGMISPS